MKTLVVGDVHAYWRYLNNLINKKKPDIILQCGDFGWWPGFHDTRTISTGEYERYIEGYGRKEKKFNQFGIKNKDCKIYWCDGNHEDHWSLKRMKVQTEVMPNVFYMPRGATLRLPTGENVMFIGGALSVDKQWRTVGLDWFPEEQITHGEIYNLPDEEVDIIISHTCPMEFNDKIPQVTNDKFKDSSQVALSSVLLKYRPKKWFFAHFHVSKEGMFEQTYWRCLNMSSETGWWTELKEKVE